MSSATMTLIGLYNYLDTQDIDLFQNLSLPDGLDSTTCINNILLQAGDNELLYPNSDFMINAIGMWSTKWNRTFTKWVEAFELEYNPIENYDRQEAWSDSHSFSESESESNYTSASDSTSQSNSGTNDVSAFNVSNYSPESASDNNNIATAQSSASGQNQRNKLENGLDAHAGRVHGNIGVTTTQQMLQQEIEVQRFNIYDDIAIIFMREFTLAL